MGEGALPTRQGVGVVGGDSEMMEPSVPLGCDLSQGSDGAQGFGWLVPVLSNYSLLDTHAQSNVSVLAGSGPRLLG